MNKLSTAAAVAAVVVTFGCNPPAHPDNIDQTVINGLCHFAYDCCTPSERASFFSIPTPDKAACVEELGDTLGGFFTGGDIAAEAIQRGTAEFDAEAAERCTAETRTAIEQCDAEKLVTTSGSLDIFGMLQLVDSADAECAALAGRGFTRGKGGAGDECLSQVDCADFGVCEEEEEDDEDLTIGGKCRPLGGKDADCTDEDFIGCQPGLACDADAKCNKPELLDDGDPCDFSSSCASQFCTASDEGTCEGSGDDCFDDFECPGAPGSCVDNECVDDGFFCDVDDDCDGTCTIAPGECAAPKITVEICNGL